ncbi:MAG: hypothetical protein KBF88_09705 [Polyangiaceae bacterium]|nr:hypothetical protein [Polyangiaceae bacterium]
MIPVKRPASFLLFALFASGCTAVLGIRETTSDENSAILGSDGGLSESSVLVPGTCNFNGDCIAPLTTPPNCAEGSCVNNKCVYAAKDADGDQHRATTCKDANALVDIAVGDDCDDTDPQLYAGKTIACVEYSGGKITNPPKGICKLGTISCNPDGTKSACTGTIGPQAEAPTCDGAKDDDCDGTVDNGCACVTGAARACGANNVGVCKFGTQSCMDGKWGACAGSVDPVKRDCGSGLDNDCNGTPDNAEGICRCDGQAAGAKRACMAHPQDGVGICRAGSQDCVVAGDKASAAWTACAGSVGPMTEGCNQGEDKDCNGVGGDFGFCVTGTSAMQCAALLRDPSGDRAPIRYCSGVGYTNYTCTGSVVGYAFQGPAAPLPGWKAIGRKKSNGNELGYINEGTCCPVGNCEALRLGADYFWVLP